MRLALAVFVLSLCTGLCASGQTLSLVQVTTSDPVTTHSLLHSLGYDALPPSASSNALHVVASINEQSALAAMGFEVTHKATGRPLAQALSMAAGGDGSIPGGYKDLAQVESEMLAAATNFPGICSLVDLTLSLGVPATVEGRHIKAVKISDNVGVHEDERVFLLAATHHCREIINPVVALHAIAELTTGYGVDPAITALVNENEIWIVPVWNPDGYEYVFNTDNLWRKNRRVFSTAVGVDLNRNYPVGWNAGCGSSNNPASNIYRGPSAASESETQTMVAFAEAMRFDKVADLHSYGQEVRCGMGCWSHQFDAFQYTEAASIGASAGYPSAPSCCLGGDIHYHMGTFGTQAFLWETGAEFQPPYATAVSVAQTVWPTLLTFLNRPISVFGRVTDATTGLPVEGTVEIVGMPFQNGEVNRSGGAFGRYRYFMPTGTYTLSFKAPGYFEQQHVVTVAGVSSQLLDVVMQSVAALSGQPNSASSSLELLGFVDPSGVTPPLGMNGPFSVSLPSGSGVLSLTVSGPAQRAFLLLMGTLNANNANLGLTGSLDIGLLGGSNNYSDVSVLLDGVSPTSFLDQLALLNAAGSQTFQFSLPGLPPGVMGTMQALVMQASGPPVLTAACKITIQ